MNPRGFFAQQHPDWLRDGNTTHATIVLDFTTRPTYQCTAELPRACFPAKAYSLAVAVRKYHAFETGSHPKQHVPQPATLPKNPNLPQLSTDHGLSSAPHPQLFKGYQALTPKDRNSGCSTASPPRDTRMLAVWSWLRAMRSSLNCTNLSQDISRARTEQPSGARPP